MPSTVSPSVALQVFNGPRPQGVGGGGAAEGLISHITDPVGAHAASAISYGGGSAWADGSTNPATDVETQIDKILSDLAGTTALTAGDYRIGVAASTIGSSVLGAGTLNSRLSNLQASVRINYSGGGAWADGTTNPQTNVEAQLDKIISDLSTAGGSAKVYHSFSATWFGGVAPSGTTTLDSAVNALVTDLASSTGTSSGARRIGMEPVTRGTVALGAESVYDRLYKLQDAYSISTGGALSSWLGGRTNPDTDVGSFLSKIVDDLGAQTASDDGAERIGAEASGNLTVGSVRSQINQLESEWGRLNRSNNWTQPQTFSVGAISSSADGYKYSGNSLARYARVHQSECTGAAVGGTITQGTLSTAGYPAQIHTTTGTDSGIFMVGIRVPYGAVLDALWYQVLSEVGASQASRIDVALYRADAAANTAIASQSSTHNNGTVTWYSLPLAYTDVRPRTDPSAAGDLEFYVARIEVKADTVLGGTQNHYFFGFALQYHISVLGQLEEPT